MQIKTPAWHIVGRARNHLEISSIMSSQPAGSSQKVMLLITKWKCLPSISFLCNSLSPTTHTHTVRSTCEFQFSSPSIEAGYSPRMVLPLRGEIRESQDADDQDIDLSSWKRLIHLHRSTRTGISACPATKWVENDRMQLRLLSLGFLLRGKGKKAGCSFCHP